MHAYIVVENFTVIQDLSFKCHCKWDKAYKPQRIYCEQD